MPGGFAMGGVSWAAVSTRDKIVGRITEARGSTLETSTVTRNKYQINFIK